MTSRPGAKLLSAHGLDKRFPGVRALCSVDFDLAEGEVHALVGENGAGKSTLVSIIAGIGRSDAGRMELMNTAYRPAGRAEAEARGVRMVMQELHLISNLSIAENIFIEKLPSRFGFVAYDRLNRAATELMERVGLGDVDPSLPVKELGVGQQQMVEIAAGLSRSCRVLALDEPTASLTDSETELLFTQIKKLKSQGVGIIYISHRIEEVMRIADRVTVLRDGKVVATAPRGELNTDRVVRLMVGRDLEARHHGRDAKTGQVGLRVVGLNVAKKVRNVSFEVRRGEILGVAGLMGSGRTETMRAVFGADRPQSGQVFVGRSSRPARIRCPRDAVRHGIALLTEDRKQQGLLMTMPVRANISLTRLRAVSRFGRMNFSQERDVARRYVKALSVRCSSTEQTAGELSGGNQQKIVIAKWLFRDPDVLIFDEPTRGIDVGIVFVSSDLKELMALCDRIMVMSAGMVTGIFEPDQWSREKIMAAALREYTGASSNE